MGMNSYIIDASVAVKWFLEEENQEFAIHLADQWEKNKIRIIVPEFFFIEMANVFWSKTKRKLLKLSKTMNMMDQLMKLRFHRYSDHGLSDLALEHAVRLGISVYDAIYVSLAEIYAAPLVTADDVLIKTCGKHFDFILPLKEFPVSRN